MSNSLHFGLLLFSTANCKALFVEERPWVVSVLPLHALFSEVESFFSLDIVAAPLVNRVTSCRYFKWVNCPFAFFKTKGAFLARKSAQQKIRSKKTTHTHTHTHTQWTSCFLATASIVYVLLHSCALFCLFCNVSVVLFQLWLVIYPEGTRYDITKPNLRRDSQSFAEGRSKRWEVEEEREKGERERKERDQVCMCVCVLCCERKTYREGPAGQCVHRCLLLTLT